jgi:hypothetical protein
MPLKSLNVQAWCPATKAQMLDWVKTRGRPGNPKPSVLTVRTHLLPIDIYCYLKARFGEPNGFQNVLRSDSSDNWIHWDYLLEASDQNINISGRSRETLFVVSEELADENWRELILAIKSDFARVGKEKSAVLKSLEKWVVFPNRFVEVANVCGELHAEILDNMGGYETFKTPSAGVNEAHREYWKNAKKTSKRSQTLYTHCLELSLMTPVLAEAFINMLIVVLCKPEVRKNKRQFDAFIRSQIDTKIFDLSYKCQGFARTVDHNLVTYKDFKRVMDERNQIIHGNCDPIAEQVHVVYFDGKRPIFPEAGDDLGKFFEAQERQYKPAVVVKNYEDTHAFLQEIMACLGPRWARDAWIILEDRYPGYDVNRHIAGSILPSRVVTGVMQGVRFDDELAVTWT